MNFDEMLFQKAIQRGLLSTALLQKCRAQQQNSPEKTVLELVLENGYMSEDQIHQISEDLGRDFSTESSGMEDESFLSSESRPSPVEDRPLDVSDLLPSVEEMTIKSPVEEKPSVQEETLPPPQPKMPETVPIKSAPKLPELPKTPMSTPFGKAAVLLKMVSKEQAYEALVAQAVDFPHKKLGEIMVGKGYLSPDQVQKILARQKTRTMICSRCEKKYQIVLYQAGRSYQCKTCKVELADIKKLKRAAKAPEKLQVMGLTQAVPIMSKTGADKGSPLDFAQEEPVPKKRAPEPPLELESVSTEAQLREVGLEIPDAVLDFTRRPRAKNFRKFYPIAFSAVVVLVICIVLYAVFGGEPPIEESIRPVENTAPTPVPTENPVERDYKKLPQRVDSRDEQALRNELEAYREYARQYPNSSYQENVSKRIDEIETTLSGIRAEASLALKVADVKARVESLRAAGELDQALSELALFAPEVRGKTFEKEVENLRQEIAMQDRDYHIQKSREMEQAKKFQEAITLLELYRSRHREDVPPTISERIDELKRNWASHEEQWSEIAIGMAYEIYPRLADRDYARVLDIMDKHKDANTAFQGNIERWQEDILSVDKLWKTLQKNLKQRENTTVKLELDRDAAQKKNVEGKLTLPKRGPIDRLQVEKSNKDVTIVKLEWISSKTLVELLGADLRLQEISERAAFSLLVFPTKDAKSTKEILPEVYNPKNDTERYYRESFAYYLLAKSHFALEKKDIESLENSLQELSLTYRGSRAFKLNRADLERDLTTYEEKIRKQSKSKADKIALLRTNYCQE